MIEYPQLVPTAPHRAAPDRILRSCAPAPLRPCAPAPQLFTLAPPLPPPNPPRFYLCRSKSWRTYSPPEDNRPTSPGSKGPHCPRRSSLRRPCRSSSSNQAGFTKISPSVRDVIHADPMPAHAGAACICIPHYSSDNDAPPPHPHPPPSQTWTAWPDTGRSTASSRAP